MSDGEPSAAGGGAWGRLAPLIDRGHRLAGAATRWLGPVALLALRLPVAVVFWRSGRTKVEGWNIFSVNDSQYFLFREEFGLPLPELMAHVTAPRRAHPCRFSWCSACSRGSARSAC